MKLFLFLSNNSVPKWRNLKVSIEIFVFRFDHFFISTFICPTICSISVINCISFLNIPHFTRNIHGNSVVVDCQFLNQYWFFPISNSLLSTNHKFEFSPSSSQSNLPISNTWVCVFVFLLYCQKQIILSLFSFFWFLVLLRYRIAIRS